MNTEAYNVGNIYLGHQFQIDFYNTRTQRLVLKSVTLLVRTYCTDFAALQFFFFFFFFFLTLRVSSLSKF